MEGVVSAEAIEKGLRGRTQEPDHCQPTVQEGAPGITNQCRMGEPHELVTRPLPPPSLMPAVPPTSQPNRKPRARAQMPCPGLLCARESALPHQWAPWFSGSPRSSASGEPERDRTSERGPEESPAQDPFHLCSASWHPSLSDVWHHF